MKDTFHGWAGVKKLNIDTVSDLILTGHKAKDARPDSWLFKYIGDKNTPLEVLDFGCGFGRNAFALANYGDKWMVTGYDNDSMLEKTKEFCGIQYAGKSFKNLRFVSDWDSIKVRKFNCIYCTLVLQHIYEDALVTYIGDFKKMTNLLLVAGRRFNDQRRKSTWAIIEEQGLVPEEFYLGGNKISYSAEGTPNEHNWAIYRM